jgi:hypothetical protein
MNEERFVFVVLVYINTPYTGMCVSKNSMLLSMIDVDNVKNKSLSNSGDLYAHTTR